MQVEKIYFDMDGVLADFDRGIIELGKIAKVNQSEATSVTDDALWDAVRRVLSDQVVINLVYRAEKQDFVKGKGCILIDDYQINVDEWISAGGTGILFESADKVLEKLKELEAV